MYKFENYRPIVFIMMAVYFFATICFDTLIIVLRRIIRVELIECAKHVAVSFVVVSVILFTTKTGATFSRAIVYTAYIIYFVLIVAVHIIWKKLLKRRIVKRDKKKTALLMTTDRFAYEGIEELAKEGYDVTNIYLLKNINIKEIENVRVARNIQEVEAVLCWEWIDKVFIYGIDRLAIPDDLIKRCFHMGLSIETVEFDYKILDVKTVANKNPKLGELSFLEGKRDIPFPIRRVYWITETEADLHRGFHAHKLNCQLLFCPYGKIDIILDNGSDKEKTVSLDEPNKGLLLMPGLWREMVWRKDGSVLCVLASEYYDEHEYIRDYDEFIAYRKKVEVTRNTITTWNEV
ncbi:MAG: WxcM-like domain-containing protein [Mogibacterium sp.]|nr:WxcM-like domain-containing protein [Mogibacterium sp.]